MRRRCARRDRERSAASRGPRRPALFGLMPDWNPAELLGEHPRPLARSLFDALLAHGTWWQARATLGYRRPPRSDLLVGIAGRPCVDVAASFASLLPATVGAADAAAAVRAWCRRLADAPALHDRVELEVAVTCAEFDRVARLCAGGLGGDRARRIADALRRHSLAAFAPARVAAERESAERRAQACWPVPGGPQALRAALAHVRRGAALPFARAARLDFIGAALLRSAVRVGALDAAQGDRVRAGSGTLAGALVRPGRPGVDGLHPEVLRPGTFEIDVPLVGVERAVHAVAWDAAPIPVPSDLAGLDALLAADGWTVDGATLLRMAADASRAREVGKFALARAIAALLEGIASFGGRLGLDRRQLGWLTLAQLAAARDAGAACDAATRAEARHAADHPLRVPSLLQAPIDLATPEFAAGRPSFLGKRAADGVVLRVARDTAPGQVPPAAVLAIESADPGFDWVFLRRPAALLTAFGGPQSHMALRCVELDVPAVLGLGLPRFERLARAARLRIDPQRHALAVLEGEA